MASKAASGNGPHAAGIFADMTVDGPEIGTLVVIVDRAKNLPNRKTVGKQNPYCAARLGKEARKTETDKRGGQTPKWDQELRFTVHDSPDYYTLKLSVFSEDNKRTDLIGEAWVRLTDVVVPGGGKSDIWQGLNCKGKYAGEVRMELTYYDSREKPEKASSKMTLAEEMHEQYNTISKPVKRRPLPANPNQPSMNPVNIPDRVNPGRARHGPRDYSTPQRANSMPPESLSYPHSAVNLVGQTPVHAASHTCSPASVVEQPPQNQHYGEYDSNPDPLLYEEPYSAGQQQPDLLPQLPPGSRSRSSVHFQLEPAQPNYAQTRLSSQTQHRPHLQPSLPHSHSAPSVPVTHQEQYGHYDPYNSQVDYHESASSIESEYLNEDRRAQYPLRREIEYSHAHSDQHRFGEVETSPPPPPPMHTHSAPAVPQYASLHGQPSPSAPRYGMTSPGARQEYIQRSSPLQSIERDYSPQSASMRGPPSRGQSVEDYTGSSMPQAYDSGPLVTPPNPGSSPYGRTMPSRQHPSRHSIADPYGTPSRPHPLSQEVPRARSPNPYHLPELRGSSPSEQPPYQQDYRGRDAVPLIKPRAISPQPQALPQLSARPKSSYNIQHPVRAFESSDQSPLSRSQIPGSQVVQQPLRISPVRKSVSPRPSLSEGNRSAVPYSPDSFDIHNPNAPGSAERSHREGPIVGWHGNEIDPSDHLPVDSWAPEPEKKTPTKTYGLGRDRDFGPRSAQGTPTSGSKISKDTVINVRMRGQSADADPHSSSGRNRLVKKSGGPGRSPGGVEPLREHENYNSVPNPYDQQQHYSSGFSDGIPGISDGRGSRYETHNAPPSIPPKVPLQAPQDYGSSYGPDALTREISSIDIGSSRNRAPTSFQPVRSQRDRHSYY